MRSPRATSSPQARQARRCRARGAQAWAGGVECWRQTLEEQPESHARYSPLPLTMRRVPSEAPTFGEVSFASTRDSQDPARQPSEMTLSATSIGIGGIAHQTI